MPDPIIVVIVIVTWKVREGLSFYFSPKYLKQAGLGQPELKGLELHSGLPQGQKGPKPPRVHIRRKPDHKQSQNANWGDRVQVIPNSDLATLLDGCSRSFFSPLSLVLSKISTKY